MIPKMENLQKSPQTPKIDISKVSRIYIETPPTGYSGIEVVGDCITYYYGDYYDQRVCSKELAEDIRGIVERVIKYGISRYSYDKLANILTIEDAVLVRKLARKIRDYIEQNR